MELNRPLFYFTVPGTVLGMAGMILGLNFLKTFYMGGSLSFGPTLLMIMFTLLFYYLVEVRKSFSPNQKQDVQDLKAQNRWNL